MHIPRKIAIFASCWLLQVLPYQGAQADLVNQDACAIWLCLPQGFLPPACFKPLIVFEIRKANPFVPAIPPLPQCIVSAQIGLTDLGGLALSGAMSFTVTQNLKSSRPSEDDDATNINTYNDCTVITADGKPIGKPYCMDLELVEPK